MMNVFFCNMSFLEHSFVGNSGQVSDDRQSGRNVIINQLCKINSNSNLLFVGVNHDQSNRDFGFIDSLYSSRPYLLFLRKLGFNVIVPLMSPSSEKIKNNK